jgi:hypothetical protein
MTISQKTPLAISLTNFTQKKVDDNLQLLGQVYPCYVTKVDGAIVTVNFQVNTGSSITLPPVTCPIAESTYIRLPVQVGDYGICIPASTRLGGITGLGTNPNNPAPIALPSNLGALVFVPIGNANWESVDPNAVNINAPNGVVLRDTNNNTTVTLNPTSVTVVHGSTQMVIDNSGVTITGNLLVHGSITGDNGFHISGGTGATMQITGDISQTGNFANTGNLTNNGKNVGSTHEHSGVQTGGSNTGVPI